MPKITVAQLQSELKELKEIVVKLVEAPAPVAQVQHDKNYCNLKIHDDSIYATFGKVDARGKYTRGWISWSDTYRQAGRKPKGLNIHAGIDLVRAEAARSGCDWLVESIDRFFRPRS